MMVGTKSKFDLFKEALEKLCLDHCVDLFVTPSGDLQVVDLVNGEQPARHIEDKTEGRS
jgi:hypothetical protein